MMYDKKEGPTRTMMWWNGPDRQEMRYEPCMRNTRAIKE